MKISDYDYDLPDKLIADQPPVVRGLAKLVVLDRFSGETTDQNYSDIVSYLNKDDVLVINDTKVIKARLLAKKVSGVERELIILESHGVKDDWHRHKVLYRKKLVAGDKLRVGGNELEIESIIGNGVALVKSKKDLITLAEQCGAVPLPPYLHRPANALDVERYQTVWAKYPGSVAAPTASLNMTEELLSDLKAKGVNTCYITLHVGLGTFLPIRSDQVEDHKMHEEFYIIPKAAAATIKAAKHRGNDVVALGTTVARTLEFAAKEILDGSGDIIGEADIFIYPGYNFKMVDKLITNFHAPRSTVLMMAAAFAGWQNLKSAYEHAKKNGYKFLSYGDSMLIK